MPNHCHNRVTFYPAGDNTDKAIEDIKAIKQMFEDENTFTQIIPEPDWHNTPLMSNQVKFIEKYKGVLWEAINSMVNRSRYKE